MQSVRDILEVFGAIDRAVRRANDPEVSAAADKLLPGSAANAGWYEELERRYFPNDPRTEPNLGDALTRIADNDADKSTPRLTRAQKARLLYGISASARLQRVAPQCGLAAFDAPDDSAFGEALIGSLAAVAPAEVTSVEERRSTAAEARNSLLEHVSSNFTRPGDFDDVVRERAVAGIRDNRKLLAPLCQTAVVVVDGRESVIVDTKFTSDSVSLDDLKSIVNPFNWNQDYAELFAAMQSQVPGLLPDGWCQVLETVRLLGEEELTTPLKFYAYQDPASPLEAEMNYDLDMSNFDAGDGQVLVDRGFINMKSTVGDPTQGGVRVVTRKVVHIQGISAFAQARLVCIGGYGTASADFLLGAATKPPASPKPFDFTGDPDQSQAETAPKPPPPGPPGPPKTPAQASVTHFTPAAVDAWTECVQDLTNGYFDVAQKWLSGSLTMNDVTDYTARVGGELASSPWKYLQAMTTPRPPGQPGGGR
jgi:hypothetical protein